MYLTECPRDAMQGMKQFIPTKDKISYLRQLLRVGFHRLDCGSFVSPRTVPQMKDTPEVMTALATDDKLRESPTRLICIVGNERGAQEAGSHDIVDYLGFPLSLSERFQQRNVGKSVTASLECLLRIRDRAHTNQQQVIVYLSMAFGNPYGEPYNAEMIVDMLEELRTHGLSDIALADTVGLANEEQISKLCTAAYSLFPTLSIGLHLHTTQRDASRKIAAAYRAGCRRLDTAMKGYGGCPMAQDELVGNLPTESVVAYLEQQAHAPSLSATEWRRAVRHAGEIFESV